MRNRVHILHVEDSETDASLFETSFTEQSRGHSQLHQVTSGEAALAFIRKSPPYEDAPEIGLVLLDLGLPQMSGMDFLQRLKSDPKTRSIPVVVLTGSRLSADYHASYQSHANAVIQKPDSLEELVELVNALDSFWTQLVTFQPQVAAGGSL